MEPATYLFFALLLMVFAYTVFRRIVRRDYEARGRLGAFASALQLIVFMAFFSFPELYNPPRWLYFWKVTNPANSALQLAGLVLILTGFVVAFGTMAWFGIRRAFGVHVDKLMNHGPYGLSRNPQIIGAYLLVIGTALQWPSLYALGWLLMFAVISHWMVITEEGHLARVFGEEYEKYCSEVPRYLIRSTVRRGSSP